METEIAKLECLRLAAADTSKDSDTVLADAKKYMNFIFGGGGGSMGTAVKADIQEVS